VPFYLGIDGGGTKTTCAIGDDTRLLATATAGPSNIVRVGERQARASLDEGVRKACDAAGITLTQVERACVGGSGAARPEIAGLIRTALAEILTAPVEVVGDMEIALDAAFDGGPGVIVIAGTGSIGYGRNQQGHTARAGGWGFAVGDEGSAHWIGRTAVRAVLHAADRKGPDTATRVEFERSPFVAGLMKAWGVASLLDLARAANSIPPPDFAKLFPVLSGSNDDLALRVLSQAGMELAQIAEVVTSRLFPLEESVPVRVAMTGGVFGHAPRVREAFYNELCRLDPRVDISPQLVKPVEGALRLARRGAAKVAG